MSDNIFYLIENLVKTIDLRKLNLKLIKHNVNKLFDIYGQLNDLWNKNEHTKINYTIT